MRILLWHGYLLGGTGSNVYTRMLAREWMRAGHDVVILCQEPNPSAFDVGGARVVRPLLRRSSTAAAPNGLLPVFVKDRYEGYDVKLVQECTHEELDGWIADNVDAIRSELDARAADLVFCNHILMGGAVGAAVHEATSTPFAVKAHGSELEFSMRHHPALAAWGARVLRDAARVFVGSAHIRRVVEDICGPHAAYAGPVFRAPLADRISEVPPGVDVDEWRPSPREESLAALLAEAARDAPNAGNANERAPDHDNAARLRAFFAPSAPPLTNRSAPLVVYFGKLMHTKGVDVLLDALSAATGAARGAPAARLIVAGFGDERTVLEERARRELGERALFTGPLEHRHLRRLLNLAEVCVVPSTFPEAFGMVAAEAAAAGCPPVVARHSGLAEIAAGLEAELPEHLRALVSFPNGDARALSDRLARIFALDVDERDALRSAARRAAVTHWSWAGVARRILDEIKRAGPS